MPGQGQDVPEEIRGIQRAGVLLRCRALDPELRFFVAVLGFRLATIYPADRPTIAVLEGHGLRLRLEEGAEDRPLELELDCEVPQDLAQDESVLHSPGGTLVRLLPASPAVEVPALKPAFLHTRKDDAAAWHTGRAGMRYRDLVPDRQGGHLIASHIVIPEGGDVPDYVHFHRVRFQFIYCHRGWVRVVYEDQGPPFVLEAGDCVLQPPGIRHRVLESSPGLEVIEVGCPAEHETHADFELELPNRPVVDPERRFAGQPFVRHRVNAAAWHPWYVPGFEARDTGIGAATSGQASVRAVRRTEAESSPGLAPRVDELRLFVGLAGALELQAGERQLTLREGDCVTLPPGLELGFGEGSSDAEFLEVSVCPDARE